MISRWIAATGLALLLGVPGTAKTTPTAPRVSAIQTDPFTRLEERLVKRLRATRDNQREYISQIVKQLRKGNLETKLIVALERYAIQRNPSFPFPFFERAMRHESTRRGVPLLTPEELAARPTPRTIR